MKETGLRPMSPGYAFTFAMAAVSLPFLGIGLGSLLLLRSGGDPMEAWHGIGIVCFLGAFALGFLVRLIFWRGASPALGAMVRNAITGVLCLLILATIYAIVLVMGQQGAPVWTSAFVTLAALCQIATITWLVRYRGQA